MLFAHCKTAFGKHAAAVRKRLAHTAKTKCAFCLNEMRTLFKQKATLSRQDTFSVFPRIFSPVNFAGKNIYATFAA